MAVKYLKENTIKMNINSNTEALPSKFSNNAIYDLTYNGFEIYPKNDEVPMAWDAVCYVNGDNFIIEGDFGQQGGHTGNVVITLPLDQVNKYYDIEVTFDGDDYDAQDVLFSTLADFGWIPAEDNGDDIK